MYCDESVIMRIQPASSVPVDSCFRLVESKAPIYQARIYRRIGWETGNRITCEVMNDAGEVVGSVRIQADKVVELLPVSVVV